jgi:hypothetical protein
VTQGPQWARIPRELRDRAQWLLAAPDAKGNLKVPTSVSKAGSLINGSSTDPTSWLTFEQATGEALARGLAIGYVLNSEDPFSCIDFDYKGPHNEPDPSKHTPEADLDQFWAIANAFQSYTEVSQSGRGLHTWVLGKCVDGARHRGVEVYSSGRFMVCTGHVLLDYPISERQSLLDQLVSDIRARQGISRKAVELDEQVEQLSDQDVWERAANADNAEKFIKLCEGKWEEYGYPSQSEADLALMSMFTFYSRSNEQCRRLFRHTSLGKRDKAQKDDRYLDYTLRLIRGRQQHEDAIAERLAAHGKALADTLTRSYAAGLAAPLPDTAGGTADVALPSPPAVGEERGLQWPPGFAGALAGFFYRAAPRPVKEVAIVAALGWLAGVAGKAWNIPGSGLNLYIILVARSAVGKEAMHSGIGNLLAKLRESVPSAQEFVDFSDFASGPALVKACAATPSFVNVAGEWGRKLKRLANDGGNDGPMQSLRTVMTNLYQKSGPASIVGGLTYSNKESNVASITGVSYSMIGETTPGTFYDALTEQMMEDGFLSRFNIIEYAGERPPANTATQLIPEEALVDRCCRMMVMAKAMQINRSPPLGIRRTAEAGRMMDAFDVECDAEINRTLDEGWRQMWNRAHLKMLRVAGLLAVGDNPEEPCIYEEHCAWALDLIRRDVGIMRRKIESGDVGTGDGTRERKLISIIREYFEKPLPHGYNVPDGMRENGIVPRSYLHTRTARLNVFTTHRMGATKALDETLKSVIDSGYIMDVEKKALFDQYGTTGRCFRVLTLPNYEHHK